ncbi:DUF4124 domain-containing protein [Aquabacterium fontiphilum]|jgi:hypothetical protein|uniref:DUF4124 domain-containing protein n=1 Tax=Aquabacterium fontiphilum TaxID=450365 RepID=UPI001378F428|nr:DUF4124 domain-containing protein [Aquabacterium fontiphilum]NBD19347.1 DUF4124 domain-containing protein [Aquabacterium fontiphilum]
MKRGASRWAAKQRQAAAGALAGSLAAALCAVVSMPAMAAQPTGIYSCVDAQGRRHTSDRPIPECLDREQRVLNRDGSQRQVVPPRMTPEQRAAYEEQRRQQALAEAARKDAIRRDRNLIHRYPDEATHTRARANALEDAQKLIAAAERQLADLAKERRGLDAETEFYKGRNLPPRLRAQIDANDAQQQAQRDVVQAQRNEVARINGLYDAELARLKRLWAGAAPGSLDSEPADR